MRSNACVRALPERSGGIRYVRRNGAHSVSDCVEKKWRLPSKDADEGGMLALCVVGEKAENRCMMTRRAEPERHDAACRKSGGRQARIPKVCLPCVWRKKKRKIRCMMERRAEPERHDAAWWKIKIYIFGYGCRACRKQSLRI